MTLNSFYNLRKKWVLILNRDCLCSWNMEQSYFFNYMIIFIDSYDRIRLLTISSSSRAQTSKISKMLPMSLRSIVRKCMLRSCLCKLVSYHQLFELNCMCPSIWYILEFFSCHLASKTSIFVWLIFPIVFNIKPKRKFRYLSTLKNGKE